MQRQFLLTVLLLSFINQAWPFDRDEVNKLISEKRYQDALEQINVQLNSQPDDVDALFLQAVAFSKLDRNKDAISLYKRLIDNYPNLPEPRNNLAVLQAQQGEFQGAEQSLQSALNTDPTYATAHSNLSELYKTLASIAYNKALNPNGKQTAVPAPPLRQIDELRSYKPAPVKIEVTPTALETKVAPYTPATTVESENPAIPADIENSITAWAKAWSQQDVEGYLNSYSTAFIPPDNIAREAWNEQRRDRIKSPGFIKIDIEQTEIQPLSNQIASVTFKQRYRSDRLSATTRKLLLLRQEGEAWRIVQEAEIR